MKHWKAILCSLWALLVLASCSSTGPKSPVQQASHDMARISVPPSSLAKGGGDGKESTEQFGAGAQQEIPPEPPGFTELTPVQETRTGRSAAQREALPLNDTQKVHVSFDKMPLNEFVHHVFGDVLKVNYLANELVTKNTKPITLNLKEPVTQRRLFELVKDVLGQEQMEVFYKEGLFYVWPKGQKGSDVQLGMGALREDIPKGTGDILQMVPIHYGDLGDISDILNKVLGLKVIAYTRENVLAVHGTAAQVENALEVLALLDRPALRGQHIALVTLEYWNALEILRPLSDALMEEGIPVSGAAGQKGVYFIPLDRLNGLIVFAAERPWLMRVRNWIKVFDRPSPTSEMSYYVYTPEFATAKDLGTSLAAILNLSENGAGAPSARGGQAPGQLPPNGTGVPGEGQPPVLAAGSVAPGRAVGAAGQTAGGRNPYATARGGGLQGGRPRSQDRGSPASSQSTSAFFSDIRFTVDESRNALIFYATGQAYQQILGLLQKMDRMPLQVAIDASVIEVTLTDNLKYGLEWHLRDLGGNPAYSVGTSLLGGSGNLNVLGLFDHEKIRVALNLLANEDLIKVLSNPKITVRDGKTASINVGTEVPIVTGESTSADLAGGDEPSILRSIQYRSTGITLSVTPTVNARGVVTLQIAQEVSEASSNDTSDIDSPIILNRSIDTEVVTGDGQTVILGGLIKENLSAGQDSVPGFSKMPILGRLFKNHSRGRDRTELVVLLTPRILRSSDEIDEMRKEFMEGFRQIDLGG